jgi:hypothetical protein
MPNEPTAALPPSRTERTHRGAPTRPPAGPDSATHEKIQNKPNPQPDKGNKRCYVLFVAFGGAVPAEYFRNNPPTGAFYKTNLHESRLPAVAHPRGNGRFCGRRLSRGAKLQNKANVAQVEQNKPEYALKPSPAEQRGWSIFGKSWRAATVLQQFGDAGGSTRSVL